MSLNDLLKEKSIRRALIVDDVCDAVPTVNDIDPGNEAWPTFNDDLPKEHRNKIAEVYPPALDHIVIHKYSWTQGTIFAIKGQNFSPQPEIVNECPKICPRQRSCI